MNATAISHDGVMRTGLFVLEVSPSSSLYSITMDKPLSVPKLVTIDNGGTCFGANEAVKSCNYTCSNGISCPWVPGGCPLPRPPVCTFVCER